MSYAAFYHYASMECPSPQKMKKGTGQPPEIEQAREKRTLPASAPAAESTPADQALVPARSGPIQAKGKTSKFNANDFDINELGPTKEN